MDSLNVKKKRNTQTLINLVSSILTLMFSAAISFFLSPYIVKTLGEEANGFTQLANNFITYASLLTISLNSMAGRFITVSYYKRDIDACKRYYSSTIIGNVFILLLLVVPSVFCVCKLDGLINVSSENVYHVKILFSFVFASFFVQQISSVFNIATYVMNKLYIRNLAQMIETGIKSILLLLVFSIFAPRMYYVSAVGFAMAVLNLLVAWVVKNRIFKEVFFDFKHFDIRSIVELISSGIWNVINQCGNILMTGMDLLMANLFIGPGPMGVLSVAKTIPTLITQLASTVNSSFSPNQTISYSSDNEKEFLNSLEYAKKISCVIISIPIMVFCVFCYDFYKLWQPTLDAIELSILSVMTLVVFVPFTATQTLGNVYTIANKLKVNSLSFLAASILSVITTFFVVKYTDLGVFAIAGISSIYSILRNLIVTIPYVSRLVGKRWFYFYKDVCVSLISCFVVGLIALGFRFIILPQSWIALVLACAVSVLVALVANFFVILNKKQRNELFRKFTKSKTN